jgi:hypothetical protein
VQARACVVLDHCWLALYTEIHAISAGLTVSYMSTIHCNNRDRVDMRLFGTVLVRKSSMRCNYVPINFVHPSWFYTKTNLSRTQTFARILGKLRVKPRVAHLPRIRVHTYFKVTHVVELVKTRPSCGTAATHKPASDL